MDNVKALFKLSGPEIPDDTIVVGTQGLRIGRSAENSLPLNHREISRQHLRIIWREDNYFVEDLNSSNGVFVNDERIESRTPVELKIGDTIRFGPYLMRLSSWLDPEPAVGRPQLPDVMGYDLAAYSNGSGPEGRYADYPVGIPHDKSNWLQYLPAIFADDEFLGRYLLIFESLLSPIIWTIDNFDLFLSPEVAPAQWLQWMAGWFDLLMLPELPIARQRQIAQQIGWLFLRRGTPAGLQRLLELYFGVTPEIVENEPCHFVVRLALSRSDSNLGVEVAERLIESQKPAFASYTLEVA